MMLENIKPGSKIKIQIVKDPTNAAAAKTLARVLSKDKSVRAQDKRLRKIRKAQYEPKPRGGRLYGGWMVKLNAFRPEVGTGGIVAATVDVLTDLKSVSRFIQVDVL